jgi:hypothetical protein
MHTPIFNFLPIKMGRDKKKTKFDCQIYKMQGGLEMGENLFAFLKIH